MTSPPPLRVAVVLDAVSPWHVGGRETRLQQLIDHLPEGQVELTIVTMKWWDREPQGPITYWAVCRNDGMYATGRRSITQALKWAFGTAKLVTRRFDVIDADQMPLLHLPIVRLAAWLRRTPMVITWHEWWGLATWREYMGSTGLVSAVVERLARRLPRYNIVTSQQLADKITATGVSARRQVVVPNAVDRAALAHVTASPHAPDILYVGRFVRQKRPEVVVATVAELVRRGRRPRVTMVGHGPLGDEIDRAIAQAGLRDVITRIDHIGDAQELWGLMKGAGVVLAPSDREGFGLVAAESLAMGTPVVTSTHRDNAIGRLVNDGITGSRCRVDDIDAYASACELWLDRPRGGSAISDALWAAHPELDWAESSRRWVEVLRATAERRPVSFVP